MGCSLGIGRVLIFSNTTLRGLVVDKAYSPNTDRSAPRATSNQVIKKRILRQYIHRLRFPDIRALRVRLRPHFQVRPQIFRS